MKLNRHELIYSFIIPCFNRADEVHELLESFSSLLLPNHSNIEIFLVDGSQTEILKPIIEPWKKKLSIHHIHKPGMAISPSRNLGAHLCQGDYLIFLDSDVLLPTDYLLHVDKFLQETKSDCFGGPDKAHPSFNNIQKAISYAMTSMLTTGGIRGGKQHLHQFHPRGFNMGINKSVFESVNGYSDMTCGEDIELSIRLVEAGYSVSLNPMAFVYHKRRSTFKSFFRQVFRFGAARINIFQRHRNTLKITHLFPAAFVLFIGLGGVTSFFSPVLGSLYLLTFGTYLFLLLAHSSFQNKNLIVGLLSVIASLLQLVGYGCGFLANAVKVFLLGKKEGMGLGASQ